MAEPRGMIAPPRQPLGWPTHRFQHCLKTVMPSKSIGANMTLHKNLKQELLPTARYDKLPDRWRAEVLPPLIRTDSQYQPRTSERDANRHMLSRQQSHAGSNADHNRPVQSRDKSLHSRGSANRSTHLDMRPPSAYSETIILRRHKQPDWAHNSQLDSAKLRAHMRENTFLPGNFSTLYKCSKEKLDEIASRLSYDPYERREQVILTDNPDGDAEPTLYTKAEIDAIVARLAVQKTVPEVEPEPEKKPLSKELSAKEKEIVERLSKYEHPADKVKEEEPEEKKTVTPAELEEILKRLTQTPAAKGEDPTAQETVKKVSAEEMDAILTRLTTYDAQKWPPESKPEIYKLHAKVG